VRAGDLNGQYVRVPGSKSILAEQLAYYRAVANEYEDHSIDVPGVEELLAAIDAFRPTGDVLELACGSGIWTQGLVRSAKTITAVDAAPEMLAQARARKGVASVRFIEADLFSWRTDDRYDTVFFGFWLSHVPEEHFESFWSLVGDCLRPGGDVFFFDDHYRTDAELIEGKNSPIVERRLNDGTPFRVVKVAFRAEELERRLREIGWDIVVTPTAGPFYWGTGGR
jgi:SAM-dependent methyltransferase